MGTTFREAVLQLGATKWWRAWEANPFRTLIGLAQDYCGLFLRAFFPFAAGRGISSGLVLGMSRFNSVLLRA